MTDASAGARARIDELIRDFYAVFDNREGRVPSDAHVTSFFFGSAIITQRQPAGFETCTPAEFAAPRVMLLRSGALVDFHEWETAARTEVEGELASRVSRYRKQGVLQGEPYGGTGTKLFQLACAEGRWRILSLAWADD